MLGGCGSGGTGEGWGAGVGGLGGAGGTGPGPPGGTAGSPVALAADRAGRCIIRTPGAYTRPTPAEPVGLSRR